jgi:hypothetical protein
MELLGTGAESAAIIADAQKPIGATIFALKSTRMIAAKVRDGVSMMG